MAITVAAGQRVTADVFNALVPKFIEKTGDESVTSSTTFQDDNDFAGISFGASEVWACELVVFVSGDPAGDAKGDWTVTGGASITKRAVQGIGIGGASVSESASIGHQGRSQADSVSYGAVDTSANYALVKETFYVETTTAGTITFRWAQRVSNATATTVRAGSYFVAHRVS